jgi:hypothetical protein
MRSGLIVAAIITLAAGPALAQNAKQPDAAAAANPPAQSEPAAPAAPNLAATLTETQAKSRIEAEGYSNVSNLKKDAKGMWNATAMKDGKPVQISLDSQGKVTLLN